MNKSKILIATGSVFITLPIWFYVLYQILEAIQANELTWFLYWVYVPFSILIGIVSKFIEKG